MVYPSVGPWAECSIGFLVVWNVRAVAVIVRTAELLLRACTNGLLFFLRPWVHAHIIDRVVILACIRSVRTTYTVRKGACILAYILCIIFVLDRLSRSAGA